MVSSFFFWPSFWAFSLIWCSADIMPLISLRFHHFFFSLRSQSKKRTKNIFKQRKRRRRRIVLEVTNFERSRSKSSSTRFRLSDTANSDSDLWCFLVLFALDADIVVFSETEALNVRVLGTQIGFGNALWTSLKQWVWETESKCEGFARRWSALK